MASDKNTDSIKTSILVLFLFILVCERAIAKRRPTESIIITTSETLTYYQAEQRARKLTAEESEILKLIVFSKEILGINEFKVNVFSDSTSKGVRELSSIAIASVIQTALFKRQDWSNTLSKSDIDKINQNAELLKKSFGEFSYAWAWVLYQQGHKLKAKSVLNKNFEEYYAEVMSLKGIDGSSNPVQYGEILLKVLAPTSTKMEIKLREEQLQKMRLHISNLPDSRMMT